MSNCGPSEHKEQDQRGAVGEESPRSNAPVIIDAEDLFAGDREVRLIFRSEEYRLRITRNSKLILTK